MWECSRETFDAWTEILSCASEFEKIVAIRIETRGFEEVAAWVDDFVTPRGTPRGRAACLAHWRAVLEDIKRDYPAGLPQWSDRDAAELKKFFAACSESVLPEDLTGRVRVSLAPLGDELATEWFLADDKKEVATGGMRGVRGVYWGRVLFRPDLEDSERDIYQEVAAIDRGAYRVLLVR